MQTGCWQNETTHLSGPHCIMLDCLSAAKQFFCTVKYSLGRRLSATLGLIAVTALIGHQLQAQDNLDAGRTATLEEIQEFLELQRTNAEDVRLHRRSAEQGDADAQLQLGLSYMRGSGVPQDPAEGIRWIRLAADQGLADAQNTLATAYSIGRGILKDEAEAVRWRRRAAEQGHTRAQILLAGMYNDGRGVIKDMAEAARWYRRAAEQGDIFAQLALGNQYSVDGILQDYILAHMWLNVASANGADAARLARDRIELSMTREEILQATDLARRCLASEYKTCGL